MLYIVVTNFMQNGYFGAYSSILNARRAILNFFNEEAGFIVEDYSNYQYLVSHGDRKFYIEIIADEIDADVPD